MSGEEQSADKAVLDLLKADFSDSYSQMRHYDQQVLELFKFTFTAYTTVTTLAIALYKIGYEYNVDLTIPLLFGLGVAFVIGLFGLSLIIRNRAYYVRVARYVNEIRREVLSQHPLGIKNLSRMYTDPSQPKHLNVMSTQTAHWTVVAALNSLLLGIFLYIACSSFCGRLMIVVLIPCAVFVVQIVIAATFLYCLDKKYTVPQDKERKKPNGSKLE